MTAPKSDIIMKSVKITREVNSGASGVDEGNGIDTVPEGKSCDQGLGRAGTVSGILGLLIRG
jgi:hypothetical protein